MPFGLRGLVVATSVALALAGCGGDPEDDPSVGTIAQAESTPAEVEPTASADEPAEGESAEEEVKAPEVVDTGFATNEYGSGVIVAVTKNPSTTHGGSVTVSGTAYDAAGQVVGTASDTLILRAGETSATASSLSVPEGKQIARVTVQAAFDETEVDEHPQARLSSRNVQVVDDGYGTFTANGEVVSAYESDLKDVNATAVCRDAAGAIQGGGFTFLDLVPGGGVTGASIDITAKDKPATCEIYSTLSFLSTLDS